MALTIAEGSFGFCKREHYLAWRETKLIPHMRELTAAGEQAYSGCTVRIPPPAFTATSRISSA